MQPDQLICYEPLCLSHSSGNLGPRWGVDLGRSRQVSIGDFDHLVFALPVETREGQRGAAEIGGGWAFAGWCGVGGAAIGSGIGKGRGDDAMCGLRTLLLAERRRSVRAGQLRGKGRGRIDGGNE